MSTNFHPFHYTIVHQAPHLTIHILCYSPSVLYPISLFHPLPQTCHLGWNLWDCTSTLCCLLQWVMKKCSTWVQTTLRKMCVHACSYMLHWLCLFVMHVSVMGNVVCMYCSTLPYIIHTIVWAVSGTVFVVASQLCGRVLVVTPYMYNACLPAHALYIHVEVDMMCMCHVQ